MNNLYLFIATEKLFLSLEITKKVQNLNEQ